MIVCGPHTRTLLDLASVLASVQRTSKFTQQTPEVASNPMCASIGKQHRLELHTDR